ncbi:MAG: flagellar hook capping FlgD N-terminal domain-containing protein [Wujia sp.]
MADAIIGGIDTSKADSYVSSKSKDNSSDLDKDAFLQLLVTQMRYQDPLDPGDSTEYMSQLAQYSSLEATMNISSTLEKGNALNLVGQYVIMNTTDSTGEQSMISGLVEYATVKDGEVLLSINDKYYPADDLDSVVDYDYFLYLQSLNSSFEDKEDVSENTGTEAENEIENETTEEA